MHMKTIKVVVERWLEVPDDWELVEPEHTGQIHLETDSHCLIPELTWLAFWISPRKLAAGKSLRVTIRTNLAI